MVTAVISPIKSAELWAPNLSPVERFIKFVTDVPPIEILVCSLEAPNYGKSMHLMRYRPSNRLYQWAEKSKMPAPETRFRYKPAAFFSRDLRSVEEIDMPWDILRQAVGVWEDDYWFLDTRMAGKDLHLYHYEPNDWSNALAGYASYMIMFGEFTSFGLSGFGPGCVVPGKSTPLEVVFRGKRYPVVLVVENGVPVQAKLKIPSRGPKREYIDVDATISYLYDTNIAPLGIPAQWIYFFGRATNRIYKIKIEDPQHPLSRDVFMPDGIFTNTALVRNVRTNRHNYYIDKDGQWRRLDLSPEAAMALLEGRPPKNRLYYFLLAALFTLLLAPAIVARVKNKAKPQQ